MQPSDPSSISSSDQHRNADVEREESVDQGVPIAPPNNGNERRLDHKPDEKVKHEQDPYLVDWEPNDASNPRNWSTLYKSWITFQLGMLAMSVSLGSSIISPAEDSIIRYTHISSEVAVMPVSLFILGFAFGPLLWAPISEVGPASPG